jgi:hypothetical protein
VTAGLASPREPSLSFTTMSTEVATHYTPISTQLHRPPAILDISATVVNYNHRRFLYGSYDKFKLNLQGSELFIVYCIDKMLASRMLLSHECVQYAAFL